RQSNRRRDAVDDVINITRRAVRRGKQVVGAGDRQIERSVQIESAKTAARSIILGAIAIADRHALLARHILNLLRLSRRMYGRQDDERRREQRSKWIDTQDFPQAARKE